MKANFLTETETIVDQSMANTDNATINHLQLYILHLVNNIIDFIVKFHVLICFSLWAMHYYKHDNIFVHNPII